MKKPTRQVMLLLVGIAVIGIAGSAAAASLAAPSLTDTAASSLAARSALAGATPDIHIQAPHPTYERQHGGCNHHWWS